MLLMWAFERADDELVLCYIDTERDGDVIWLYKKDRYLLADQWVTSLESCGMDGVYTHVL